jgi:hypothetical protein
MDCRNWDGIYLVKAMYQIMKSRFNDIQVERKCNKIDIWLHFGIRRKSGICIGILL